MTPAREFIDLLSIVRGYQRSKALTVVAELGITDLLRQGARPVEELAAETNTKVEPLYRVLRALASLGVFREDLGRSFALTAMGEFLRTDHPLTVAPVARMFAADYEWKAWGELLHSLRTGENAAVAALGVDVWEYRRQHPADSEVFDAAMRTFSMANSPALTSAYDFGQHRLIADIGGGTGANLVRILQACPAAHGILFDQPHVVAGAGEVLSAGGVAQRVEVVGGSFFESVPSGADAYLLVRVLHDWMDTEAASILRCIRRCMPESARLLVIDAVVGPPNEDEFVKFLACMP
jgi:hypothetical protein